MPTPASGAISMNDMRTHINRATSSSISMSEMRTRYGGSGAISFSDLYDSEGFVITCGTYSDKFYNADGFSTIFNFGSVTPNEASGRVQFAANSYLADCSSTPAGVGSNGGITLYDDAINFGMNVTAGYRGTDVTRIVIGNTSLTIQSSSNTGFGFQYDFPASGTIHCLIKF